MNNSAEAANKHSNKHPQKIKSPTASEIARIEEQKTVSDDRSTTNFGTASTPPGDPINLQVFHAGSMENQIDLLKNPKFSTTQRQTLAVNIGRIQGNYHLQRLIAGARQDAPNKAAVHVPDASSYVQRRSTSGPTRADQERKASETLTRLRSIHRRMLRHDNRTVRNTAQLFVRVGSEPPRLSFQTMTLRSDNATLLRSLPATERARRAYFFYGPRQTSGNQHLFSRNTMGTIQGNSIVIRGHDSRRRERSEDDIISAMAHEASHILVASYGEHPGTSTSVPGHGSSFDRYKDEFRAYWIEPVGDWARMRPDDRKAEAIRKHLVGESATDTRGYAPLRRRYWARTADGASFRRLVDGHRRPDGFNLTNSRNLDLLFQMINRVQAGTPPLTLASDVVVHILRRMSTTERDEAHRSRLIQRMLRTMGGHDADQIRNALAFPRTPEHAAMLNPTRSPRVTNLLEAIAHNSDDDIKSKYQALTPEEKSRMRWQMAAAMLVFIRGQIPVGPLRAATIAMVTGGGVGQFDAMQTFLEECMMAQIDAAIGTLRGVPRALRNAIRRLTYHSRLALYRLAEDTRREYVDALPDPVKSRLLHALREGGDP